MFLGMCAFLLLLAGALQGVFMITSLAEHKGLGIRDSGGTAICRSI